MAIELNKINDLYNKSKKLIDEINKLNEEFKKIIHDDELELYLNPFDPTHILLQNALESIDQSIYLFFRHRFMETYCPNLESIEGTNFNDAFEHGKFDAITLIEFLKEHLLSRGDVEAYENMRRNARSIFDHVYLKEIETDGLSSKIIRGSIYVESYIVHCDFDRVKEYRISWNSIVRIKQFEKFAHFIIDHLSLLSKQIPPSQYEIHLPIFKELTYVNSFPIDLSSIPGPINRFKCYKNGSVSFYFNSIDEASIVMRALSGQFTPDFETVQIDIEEMFKLKPEYQNRARRVVKM